MKQIIKNFEQLATSALRSDALAIAEAGLQAIDTESILEKEVVIEGDVLKVQGRHFNLQAYKHIYIIGFGKVSCTAAYTLENILKDRIKDGAVIGISPRVCQVVETYTGTHPLPSQQNYIATKHIAEVARSAKEDDLVIVIVSGGGSALLCSSMGECDQGNALFESFLPSGGTIEELNIVRKHISQLKGGGLAKALYPATVVGLIFSDVPGGDMSSVASGPTYFDASTIQDAQQLIDRYNLGSFQLIETPKDPKYFARVHNFTIVSNVTALNAMQAAAKERSYRADLISATQYATADETKALFFQQSDTGTVGCMGGETKVHVPEGVTGNGGRNTHLAISMLEELSEQQVFISLASDGRDNADAAGAIADHLILAKAKQKNLAIATYRDAFDSSSFFTATEGHIATGLLESNVSDLMLLLTAHPTVEAVEITDITARVIKDSRGTQTLEVTVVAGEHHGVFSVPSGASTGDHEVAVLPVKQALQQLRTIVRPRLLGMLVTDQAQIDQTLHDIDGTATFATIGGNLALGISVAATKAAAAAKGIPTWQYIAQLFQYKEQANRPRLFVNLINGGKHATYGSPIQEHQIIPDTDDVRAAFAAARLIQHELRVLLQDTYGAKQVTIGDEGGFVIPSATIQDPFIHIMEAIRQADTTVPILLGADMAASSFAKEGAYQLLEETCTTEQLLGVYKQLHTQFPMLQMVEDPFEEHDQAAFAAYKNQQPGVLTIGDDLTTTNKAQLQRAIEVDAINAIIIKPNQIGTVSDTLATMDLAYANKIWCIVSHRSGETMDDFIADLAYGTKCFGLKAGAPDREERAVKYHRLLQIASS